MGSTIVFDFLIFRRRTGPADTGARIVLDLGTDGDEFAVPTRIPTVRRGTRSTDVAIGTNSVRTVEGERVRLSSLASSSLR